ncbi:hypothetical protein GWK47_014383 [Chionoecetes opilio]|uniref:Uncharacterized protein n=1 Tax=Chionoecetes opilio TaxID=41210 RepID=A0A8J4XTG3_CHIOP|nr:hypothetical protein GWK47_014383 [Chionoecetes opilio]
MEGGHPPNCDDCLVPLTVRHLLVECPSLGDLREQFLSRCRGSDGAYRLSLALGERCFSPGHEVHNLLRGLAFSASYEMYAPQSNSPPIMSSERIAAGANARSANAGPKPPRLPSAALARNRRQSHVGSSDSGSPSKYRNDQSSGISLSAGAPATSDRDVQTSHPLYGYTSDVSTIRLESSSDRVFVPRGITQAPFPLTVGSLDTRPRSGDCEGAPVSSRVVGDRTSRGPADTAISPRCSLARTRATKTVKSDLIKFRVQPLFLVGAQ